MRRRNGVQGRSPCTKNEGGRCRRGESPLTRTGRCKKIVVSQGIFGKSLVPCVARYSQFSCGFRRASGRFPTSRTTDKCCFSGICRPQQATSNLCLLSCCGGPLTRTGRCKKVVVSQGIFGKSLGRYVPRYIQFSCGFRRASGRSRPPPTPPAPWGGAGASPLHPLA